MGDFSEENVASAQDASESRLLSHVLGMESFCPQEAFIT